MTNKLIKARNKTYNQKTFVNNYLSQIDFIDELINDSDSHHKAIEIYNTIRLMALKQFEAEYKGKVLTEKEKDKLFN